MLSPLTSPVAASANTNTDTTQGTQTTAGEVVRPAAKGVEQERDTRPGRNSFEAIMMTTEVLAEGEGVDKIHKVRGVSTQLARTEANVQSEKSEIVKMDKRHKLKGILQRQLVREVSDKTDEVVVREGNSPLVIAFAGLLAIEFEMTKLQFQRFVPEKDQKKLLQAEQRLLAWKATKLSQLTTSEVLGQTVDTPRTYIDLSGQTEVVLIDLKDNQAGAGMLVYVKMVAHIRSTAQRRAEDKELLV